MYFWKSRGNFARQLLLFLLVGIFSVLIPAQGKTAEVVADIAEEKSDLIRSDLILAEECKRQLNLLFEACQVFRRANGRLPASLTDLLGNYLSDGSILICPVAREMGNYGLGHNYNQNFDIDPLTTYFNEFNDRPVRPFQGVEVDITERELRHRMRKETPIGNRVPIIRCLQHSGDTGPDQQKIAINLSYEGKIYESNTYWESEFSDEIPTPYLVAALLVRGSVLQRVKPRKTDNPDLLDISHAYNAIFEDPWWVGAGDYGLREMAVKLDNGLGEFDGIEFDVRGVVQIAGEPGEGGFRHLSFPYRSKPIPVDRKCGRIHLLHGTIHAVEFGESIATLNIRYRGSEDIFQETISYGRDVERMRFDVNTDQNTGGPVPAWTGDDLTYENPDRRLRIFTTSFTSPRPDEVIESLEFESKRTRSAPFILAISIE